MMKRANVSLKFDHNSLAESRLQRTTDNKQWTLYKFTSQFQMNYAISNATSVQLNRHVFDFLVSDCMILRAYNRVHFGPILYGYTHLKFIDTLTFVDRLEIEGGGGAMSNELESNVFKTATYRLVMRFGNEDDFTVKGVVIAPNHPQVLRVKGEVNKIVEPYDMDVEPYHKMGAESLRSIACKVPRRTFGSSL